MKRIEKSLIAMAIAFSIVSSPVLPFVQIEASEEPEQPPEMTVVSEPEINSLIDESTEFDIAETTETDIEEANIVETTENVVEEIVVDETILIEEICIDELVNEETLETVEEIEAVDEVTEIEETCETEITIETISTEEIYIDESTDEESLEAVEEIEVVDEVSETDETFVTEIVIGTEASEVIAIEEVDEEVDEETDVEIEETEVIETEVAIVEPTEIIEEEQIDSDETVSYEYPIEEVEPNVFVANTLDEYLDYLSSMNNVEKLIINTTDDLTVLFAECGVYYEGTYVLGFTESSMYENAVCYCMKNGYEFSIDGEMSICTDGVDNSSNGNVINPNASIRVAVIDTGSNLCNEAYSVIGDSVTDVNGHGTRMSSLILGETSEAYIISIKALGDNGKGDVSDVYAALELARELDVDVILLAISVRDYGQYGAFKSLIEVIMNSGITVIVSAGNNNTSASVYIPGGIDGVTTVGSIDNLGYKTANSNYGYSVDYYVISDSTSEAAAIFTGKYISGDVSDIATEYKDAIVNEDLSDTAEDEEIEVTPIEESFTTNGYNGTPYIYWVDGNSLATYGYKSGAEFANAIIANCKKMEGAAYSQSVQGKVDCITYVNLAYAATLGQISNLRMENGQVRFDGSVAGGTYQLYSTTGATSCLYWGNMSKHNVGNGGVPYTSLSATLSQYGARKGDIVLFGKFNTLYRAVVTVPGGTVTTQWVSSKTQATSDATAAIQANHGSTYRIEATEGNEFDWTHAAIYSGEGTDFYEALSTKLPAGLYTISDSPQIDVTDGSAKSYNRIAILSYLEPTVYTDEDVKSYFKIVKTTEDGKAARGAKFEVYTEDNKVFATFSDSANNGNYKTSIPLPIGAWNTATPTQVITKYYYRETKAATEYYDGSKWVAASFKQDLNRYTLYLLYDPTTDVLHYTVCREDEKTGALIETIIEDVQIKNYRANGGTSNPSLPGITHTNLRTGSVSVIKVDVDGNTLTGATFVAYSDALCTKSVGTLSYDSVSKSYKLSGLDFGTYYLKETSSPSGFINDPNSYKFTISSSNLNVIVDNTSWSAISGFAMNGKFVNVQYGSVSVKKVDKNGTALTGATFTVYSDSACTKSVGTLTYDSTNKIYKLGNLNVATTYYLKETKAPTGYMVDPNVYSFTPTAKNNSVTISNSNWTVISDVKRANEFVNVQYGSVSVKKVDKNGTALTGATFTVYSDSACTKSVGTLTYDSTNKIYKLGNLNVATTYYLKETKAPTGYMVDPNVYSFTPTAKNNSVTISNSNWTVIADVKRTNEFVNAQLGSVTVKKVTPNGTELSGAIFTVYSDADCTKKVGTLIYDTTAKIYKLGGLNVATTYYLKETVAPKNYYLDPNVYSFKPTAKAPEQKITNVTWDKVSGYNKSDSFVDLEILGGVTINKVDVNGTAVAGATFTVYSDSACTKSVGTMKYNVTKKVYELNNLSLGTYYVKETTAPSGFIKDPNKYSFTLTSTNLNVTVSNTSWTAISGATQAGKFVEPRFGSVTVKKVTPNGTELSGATFTVYSDADCTKKVGTLIYDTTAKIYKLGGLNVATIYYLKETVAPKNYYLDPNVYSFKPTAKAPEQKITNVTWDKVSGYNKPDSFVDPEILGGVTINKVDINGTAVAGATFTVYSDSACTKSVGTMKYNATKKVYELNNLSLGTYYVKETAAPSGFIKDPNTYSFTLTSTNLNAAVSNTSWTAISGATQAGKFVEPRFGSVTVKKVDENGTILTDAEFKVYSDADCSKIIGTLIYDTATQEYRLDNLNIGTYYLKETTAPKNYYLDPNVYSFAITAKDNDKKISNVTWEKVSEFNRTDDFVDLEILGEVSLKKVDVNGAPVAGADFVVYSDSECTKIVNTLTYNESLECYELKNLSLGTYYLKETVAPEGFIIDPNVYSFELTETELSVVISNATWETLGDAAQSGMFVEPEFGSVNLNKVDENGNRLSGAEFVVYGDEECTVEVGKLTELDGTYSLDNLYMGTYYLKEIAAPINHYLDPNVYVFEITAKDNKTVISNTTWEKVSEYDRTDDFVNPEILGNVSLEKIDVRGNAVSGAVFTVYKDSTCTQEVGSLSFNDETLKYELNNLSLGTYYLKEIEAPAGFIADPNIYEFSLTAEELNVVVANESWAVISEAAVEGKFVEPEFGKVTLKKTDEKGTSLSGAKFVVYSDEECADEVGALTEIDGVYELGNLYIGTYYLKETKAPVNYYPDPNVYVFEITATDNCKTITNVTWEAVAQYERDDEFVNLPKLGSVTVYKRSEDGLVLTDATFVVYRDEELTDTVGELINTNGIYTLEGLTVGTYYLAEKVPPMGYELDSNSYRFEITENQLDVIVTNVNWEAQDGLAPDSFVNYNPVVKTVLTDNSTMGHTAPADTKVTLTDTVSYDGLIPGKTYVMSGTLYYVDKNGKALLDEAGNKIPLCDSEGNVIVSDVEFVPEDTTGVVAVEFVIDSTLLMGKTVYCEEDCYRDDRLVGFHHEVVPEQTAFVPEVFTQFYDRNLGDEYDCTSYGSITLVDKVTVANITAGTYEVTGTIHLKSSGEALNNQDGKVISSTTVFEVTEDELINGCCTKTVEVVFENVDVTNLEGESLVCFENLTSVGVTLVTHEDLEDSEQTVRVPRIGTTLVEPESQTSVVYISEECVLEDVIKFEGLTPGKEYEATGTLYDVQTGEAILNSDGTPVVSEVTKFIPQTCDGEVKVTFRFNSSLITSEIRTIVAFEDVYDLNSGRLVATHADLNDTNQQVKVPSVTTTATVNGNKVFLPNENASLKDVISYTGLEAGRTYRVETSVMRKDGTEFQVDGVSVNNVSVFTPTDSDGFYSVEFSFNAKSLLNEQQLVVYQLIYDDETNRLVASHCDKDSEGQTVTARFIVTTGEDGTLVAAHTMMGVASAVSAAGLLAVMNKRRKNESEKDKEDS